MSQSVWSLGVIFPPINIQNPGQRPYRLLSTTAIIAHVCATDRATNAAAGTGGVETIAVARGKAVRIAETLWVLAFSLL